MMIRALTVILYTVCALIIAWAGFNGLNPWIALPMALLILAIPHYLIAKEAANAGIKITDYLEYLDKEKQNVQHEQPKRL